jgi:hypothetical protein
MEEDRDFPFRWKDDAVSLRAHRLAVVTRWALDSNACGDSERERLLAAAQKHFDELRDPTKLQTNNHGVLQMRGMMALAHLLPGLHGAAGAGEYAATSVNALWARQYAPEGVHVENSPHYHIKVVREFESIVRAPEFCGLSLGFDMAAVERAASNARYFFHPNGQLALLGDSHRVTVDALGESISGDFASALAFAAGARCDAHFRQAGYVVLAGDRDDALNRYLIARTGFASRTHRHADDFSFEWSENGEIILTDAGRYSYNYQDPMREFVTHTRAHNTVCVDGLNYPWWGSCRRRDFYPSAATLLASRRDYSRVRMSRSFESLGVAFAREIALHKGSALVVTDELTSASERDYVEWFHFSPQFRVVAGGEGRFVVKGERNSVTVTAPAEAEAIVACGQTEPDYQGWVSSGERAAEPNMALGFRLRARRARYVTRFDVAAMA